MIILRSVWNSFHSAILRDNIAAVITLKHLNLPFNPFTLVLSNFHMDVVHIFKISNLVSECYNADVIPEKLSEYIIKNNIM